jgi:nucleotide-binding universal stress UspA family protein
LIRKILVAFDGSDHSKRALDFALDLAQQYSAETQLLTVVPPLFLPIHTMTVTTSELVAETTKQLENEFIKVLNIAEEKARKERANLKFLTRLEYGRPEEKIVETAKEGHFDLIVMGSRGLGRKEYAIGSVSSTVVDCATCPVLIVK